MRSLRLSYTVLRFIILILPAQLMAQNASRKQIRLYPKVSQQVSVGKSAEVVFRDSLDAPKFDQVSAGMSFPLEDLRVTSKFGRRRHPVTGQYDFHSGIDLAARAQIVRSILQGTVKQTGYHKNLGYFVRVDHGSVESVYGHLSRITVEVGSCLLVGYPIGVTGSSGRVTGEHLHFGICHMGVYIDPWPYLQALSTAYNNKK